MVMAEYIKGEKIRSIDELQTNAKVFCGNIVVWTEMFDEWRLAEVKKSLRVGDICEAIEKKKTIRDDFFEKYPNAPRRAGFPNCSPDVIGYNSFHWNDQLPEKEGQQ